MCFSGKYIAIVFSLNNFLESECILKLFFFFFGERVVRNQNQGYVSRKCIPRKIFEQIGIGMFDLYIFLITMDEIGVYAVMLQRCI